MFGDKLATATAKITALVGLIAATGLKIDAANIADSKTEAGALPGVDTLKAHLAGQEKTAIAAALAPVNAQLSAASVELAAYKSALEGAGIALSAVTPADFAAPSADKPAPAIAAIQTAVSNAIAARASKQVAASGHPHAIDVPRGNSAAENSAETAPATAEEFLTQLRAIADPGKRTEFYRKHAARFVK